MSQSLGLTTRLEDWLAAQLAAIEYDGKPLFRTAQVWTWQLSQSGPEAFVRFAPFAFVAWQPAQPAREGDFDLRGVIKLHVLIGVTSEQASLARRGSLSYPGASKIRDLVCEAIDQENPGTGYNVDDIVLVDEYQVDEGPKHFAFALVFQTNQLSWSE